MINSIEAHRMVCFNLIVMNVKNKIQNLVEAGVKIAVGFVPGASNAFNSLFDAVKNSIIYDRAEKWKNDVASRLSKLETDFNSLANSESFATALIKSSEIAIKTASDEKREILANALVNSYIQNVDDIKLTIYLELVDKYTVFHVGIIKYFHDEYMNERFYNNNTPTIMSLLRLRFNKIDKTYLYKVINDLQNDYLIEKFEEQAPIEILHKRFNPLTKFGNEFYSFLMPACEENK